MTAMKRPSTQKEIQVFRRLSLIEGALESIATHGLNGTTVQTISESSGSSRGLVNHYFKNKDELIVAAYRHLADEWENRVSAFMRESGKSAEERLKALAIASFHPDVLKQKWLKAYLAFWNEAQHAASLRNVNREVNAHYRETVTRLFARAGVEKSCLIDAEGAALGLLALIDGLWLQLAIDPSTLDASRAQATCCAYIDRMLIAIP
jgi:TetR/AcrR family transcriptional repressor of bet genes